jgi:hypothetical protein
MVATSTHDIMAFVETWHLSFDANFIRHCRKFKYQIIDLPAELSLRGRHKGGIFLLIKR